MTILAFPPTPVHDYTPLARVFAAMTGRPVAEIDRTFRVWVNEVQMNGSLDTLDAFDRLVEALGLNAEGLRDAA